MSTCNNFTATIPLTDYSAENWEALVRDGVSAESTNFDKVEMRMLRNAHLGTSHVLKSYIDSVLNGAINYYNGVMNRLDPIKELYDMYSEEEDTPRIVELADDKLDFVSDIEGPADPYMDL